MERPSDQRLYGALCTYRRPGDLEIMLDALAEQERPLDELIIIDNAGTRETLDIVDDHPVRCRTLVEVIPRPDNPGPAGGFAAAHAHLRGRASADDLVLMLDDDDPPPSATVVSELVDLAVIELRDPTVAGIGLRGGVLSRRTGVIEPRPRDEGADLEHADHLHGNWFPLYRFGALEAINGYDETLFWGFEELDVGRRLRSAGLSLRVATASYRRHGPSRTRARWFGALPEPSWRHYYRHRNLLRILRRERAWLGLAVTIGVRLIAKPLVMAPIRPRTAAWHLRTNLRAIRDGLGATSPSKHPAYLPEVVSN